MFDVHPGAETLAYLIEVDTNLQKIAAISDHIIPTLAEYFRYPGTPPDSNLMPVKKVKMQVNMNLLLHSFHIVLCFVYDFVH